MEAQTTEMKILVDDLIVAYFDEGYKHAHTIILVHGFPLSKEMWHDQLEALKATCRVVAYDIRGHGATTAGQKQFTITQFADDLIALMDALHIEKAVVCGLSMGGYIALNAIDRFAHRFSGLVLCDTTCTADSPEGKEKRQKAIELIETAGISKYAVGNLQNLFAPASFETHAEAVVLVREMIINTVPSAVIATLKALAARNETCYVLPLIKVPVSIIVGSEDKITPPSAAIAMKEKAPNARLHIIDQAGHLANLENPEAFNTALLSAVSRA